MLAWLRQRAPEKVDEALAAELAGAFPSASESLRRHALIESGYGLDPLVEGVRQDSLDDLERTLLALLSEYEAGSRARRAQVRHIVITAREHAQLASRNQKVDEAKRALKTEMTLWLLTWLENPPAFPVWVQLRKSVLCARPVNF
jgi:hypothetical protein